MNDIRDLRSHLFNTLTALQDKENPMDIERAKAVCQVGGVLIDVAKAEIDFARVNGSVDTQFFHKPGLSGPIQEPEKLVNKEISHGITTVDGHVTTHRAK